MQGIPCNASVVMNHLLSSVSFLLNSDQITS